jgi:hypothetical protein
MIQATLERISGPANPQLAQAMDVPRQPELQASMKLALHCNGFEGDFRVGIIRFRNIAHLLATHILEQEAKIAELQAQLAAQA